MFGILHGDFGFRTTSLYKDCKIMALPQKYQKTNIGMALPKDSPYHGMINHYVLIMIESGMINKLLDNTKPPEQECDYEVGSPLGFNNCITPFLVLIGGIGLGLILLFLEASIFKQNNHQEDKLNDKEESGVENHVVDDPKEPEVEVEEPIPGPSNGRQPVQPNVHKVVVIEEKQEKIKCDEF